MKETRSLFQDAMTQLMEIFKENSGNRFLARLLLENESLLRKIYGPKGAKEVFRVMYQTGVWEAYQFVARGYLESEHYDLAYHYFSKAVKTSPLSQELQSLCSFSLGMNAYYHNAYSKALSHLSKFVLNKSKSKVNKEYLKKAEEVCHHIFSELKEEGRIQIARRARSLADRIRKCYSENRGST